MHGIACMGYLIALLESLGLIPIKSPGDSSQAIKILNMIKVFGKPIRVNKASTDKSTKDVGANLFIGNLDPDVDEKVRMVYPRYYLS